MFFYFQIRFQLLNVRLKKMNDGPYTEKDLENNEVLAKRKCNILKGPISV